MKNKRENKNKNKKTIQISIILIIMKITVKLAHLLKQPQQKVSQYSTFRLTNLAQQNKTFWFHVHNNLLLIDLQYY
jgi:hypothetical protein